MFKALIDALTDEYTLKILLGTITLGFAAGAIGVFSTLRKQALIGDALSHAALPGIVIAFVLFSSKNLEVLLLGAAAASLVAMLVINTINKYSNIKFDASMALILSGFFGLGNVLMFPFKGQGLDKFIFGEAATILRKDVNLIIIIAFISITLVILFWRHIKLFIFNEEFYESLGFNSTIIRGLLTFLTVLVVVISIRAVGVVLMSALLIAPAVVSRLWSDKFSVNFVLAGIVGAISGGLGTFFSMNINKLPTGPAIVVVLSIFVILTLLFSPKKGIISTQIKVSRHRKLVLKYHVLVHIYEYGEARDADLVNVNTFIEEGFIIKNETNILLTNKGEVIVNSILRGENIWA